MPTTKKSVNQTILDLLPGDKVRISLADVKYMSIANVLYRARLEGRQYRQQLAGDKASVIVERIS